MSVCNFVQIKRGGNCWKIAVVHVEKKINKREYQRKAKKKKDKIRKNTEERKEKLKGKINKAIKKKEKRKWKKKRRGKKEKERQKEISGKEKRNSQEKGNKQIANRRAGWRDEWDREREREVLFSFFVLMTYQLSWIIQCQNQKCQRTAEILFKQIVGSGEGGLKLNTIVGMEFELAYFEAAVQHFSHYATESPSRRERESKRK